MQSRISRAFRLSRRWSMVGLIVVMITPILPIQGASASATWTPINTSPSTAGATQAYGLAVSENGMNMAVAMSYGYVWVSSDGGATWSTPQIADMNSATRNWRYVAMSPDGLTVIAIGIDLMWRSADGGVTWTDVNPGLHSVPQFFDVAISDDGRYVLVCMSAHTNGTGKLYLSTDGGVNWTLNGPDRIFTGCVTNDSGSVMYAAAGGQGGDINGGVYKSTDYGATWTHIRPAFSLDSSSTLDRYAWLIDVDDTGDAVGLTYYGSQFGYFYRSMDGGATWTASPSTLYILRRPAVQTYGNRTFFHAVINGGYTFSEGLGTLTNVTVLANKAASDFVITSNLSKSWLLNYDDVIYTTGAIQSVQDVTAPSVTLTPANLAQPANAVVSASERGTTYLVHSSVNVSAPSDITSAPGNLWNSVSVVVANSSLNMTTSGLIDGTYRAYAVDSAGNLSAASNDVVVLAAPSIVGPSPTTTTTVASTTTTTIAPATTVTAAPTTTVVTVRQTNSGALPVTGSGTETRTEWATVLVGLGVLMLLRVRVQRRYQS